MPLANLLINNSLDNLLINTSDILLISEDTAEQLFGYPSISSKYNSTNTITSKYESNAEITYD